MLTVKQIKKLAEDDWEIYFMKGYHPLGYKGWFLPDEDKIKVYLPAHKDKKDLSITIIHELIHARDCLKREAARSNGKDESKAEREALETYTKHPRIVEVIKTLYNLEII